MGLGQRIEDRRLQLERFLAVEHQQRIAFAAPLDLEFHARRAHGAARLTNHGHQRLYSSVSSCRWA